ncbi:polyprenyl synthetase family protein [Streptomyces longisporoflavus]|uniref:Polyprenyl synthetase family protein n=1 Tax=Streptomyces longisporoflavus TaxID=28044 RepID=A0ABW7QF39_9ACTN
MSQIVDSCPVGAVAQRGWVENLLVPALRKAVAALPPAEGRVAGYHRGWCEADGSPSPGTAGGGGKSVRPRLAMLSSVAVGGTAADAVPAAVAVELVHDFTLLHDDVIDGDALRRYRPAAWSAFGTPAALLTGDALLVSALSVVSEVPRSGEGAVRELVHALLDLVRGQSDDVAFEAARQVSVAEYLAMAEGKTGALMGCACALGGVLAGADAEQVDGLRGFGRRLGVAFQCADDLLGIWGSSARSGKPVGADLAARKKSLPVVAALAEGGPASRRLRGLYGSSRPFREGDIALATRLVEEAGGRRAAEEEARRQVTMALRSLSRARPGAQVYGQLRDIAGDMIGRER